MHDFFHCDIDRGADENLPVKMDWLFCWIFLLNELLLITWREIILGSVNQSELNDLLNFMNELCWVLYLPGWRCEMGRGYPFYEGEWDQSIWLGTRLISWDVIRQWLPLSGLVTQNTSIIYILIRLIGCRSGLQASGSDCNPVLSEGIQCFSKFWIPCRSDMQSFEWCLPPDSFYFLKSWNWNNFPLLRTVLPLTGSAWKGALSIRNENYYAPTFESPLLTWKLQRNSWIKFSRKVNPFSLVDIHLLTYQCHHE